MGERYRIVHIADTDSVGERDVIDFWDREGAMPPEVARERVREVAFVGLEEQEGVVAVSTVFLRRAQRVGMDLWHFRTLVAPGHRKGLLAEQLIIRTREYLKERFVSGLDVRGAGLFVEVENEILKTVKNEAVWPDARFAFIGEDPKGKHLRVHYFPGARVPPPP